MQKLRTLAVAVAVVLTAVCGGSGGGPTPPPAVATVLVTPSNPVLPGVGATQQFAAQPLDASGTQVTGVTVTWASSDPLVATITSSGLATAQGVGTAFISATAEGKSGTAMLTVEGDLTITTRILNNARLTLGYDETVVVTGAASLTFTLASGSLPAGVSLGATTGRLTGTPTALGSSAFTVRVEDSEGNSASQPLTLTVCEAPVALAVGESWIGAAAPAGGCGYFIPSGAASDYYRVAVLRTGSSQSTGDVQSVDLTITGIGGVAALAPPPTSAPFLARSPAGRGLPRIATAALRRRLDMARGTAAAHAARRESEARMLADLGTRGLLPDRRAFGGQAVLARVDLPNEIQIDPSTPTSGCAAGTPVTAVKLAEDDHLAVFQDKTQNENASTKVLPAQAQLLVDYYADYGKEIIDGYFGGVPDINSDGKVIVFITPTVGGNTAAYVWSGDFFEQSVCAASNEKEIIYFNHAVVEHLGDFGEEGFLSQGLETLVHEMKHVSSLYQRLERGSYHPTWVEESTAEIAGGMSSRLAWSRLGGPQVNAMLVENDWRDFGDVIDETYGVLVRLFRTQEYLGSQPNGLTAVPTGARPNASIYGSWTFFRWLGDAYGDAASAPLADGDFFKGMNDADAPSGIDGITEATGRTWEQLLEEFVQALMTNGLDTPQPERAITTYDFISGLELFCFAVGPGENQCPDQDDFPGVSGFFPWPVTASTLDGSMSRSFVTAEFEGSAGPAGIRFYDFRSNGTGQGAEINVDAPGLSRVIVRRLN
ncbi:MAG TPA: putative Ig domain-containing protein [Longimicrobiales bacterium]|jgi:hypothetical protein